MQLSSGQLFDDPVDATQRAASFFGRELDAGKLRALAGGEVLRTHSKTGRPFDANARAREQQLLSSSYGAQADAVVEWAEAEKSRSDFDAAHANQFAVRAGLRTGRR